MATVFIDRHLGCRVGWCFSRAVYVYRVTVGVRAALFLVRYLYTSVGGLLYWAWSGCIFLQW